MKPSHQQLLIRLATAMLLTASAWATVPAKAKAVEEPMVTNRAMSGLVTIAFNRTYSNKVHVGMTLDALVKATAGIDGRVLRSNAGITTYHWDGADRTYLEADVQEGVVKHLMVVNPKGAIVIQSLPGD